MKHRPSAVIVPLLILVTSLAPPARAGERDAIREVRPARWAVPTGSGAATDSEPAAAFAPGDNRWWDGFGSGNGVTGEVFSLAEHEGYLYVGGYIQRVGSIPVGLVGRWDGESWSNPGFNLSGEYFPFPAVYTMVSYGGMLVMGGDFYGACTYGFVAWDGDSLRCLGDLETWLVYSMVVHEGTLYLTGPGVRPPGGDWGNYVVAWDGTEWTTVGGEFNDWLARLTIFDGRLVAAGNFTSVGGVTANRIALWDGSAWAPIGGGFNGAVGALASYRGELVAAGAFSTADGEPASRIASWDGSAWHPLGSGFPPGSAVNDLAVLSGDLIACGGFLSAGGVPANRIAAWNGHEWRALGSGLGDDAWVMFAEEEDPLGTAHLFVGGYFSSAGGHDSRRIARWDPISRSAMLAGPGPAAQGGDGSAPRAALAASPSPFRDRTTIRFQLARAGRVSASAYDLRGRLACRLFEGALPSGPHAIEWEGRDEEGRRLPAGVYFVFLHAGSEVASGRVLLSP